MFPEFSPSFQTTGYIISNLNILASGTNFYVVKRNIIIGSTLGSRSYIFYVAFLTLIRLGFLRVVFSGDGDQFDPILTLQKDLI